MATFEFSPRYYKTDTEEKYVQYVPVPICDYDRNFLMNSDDVITTKNIIRVVFVLCDVKVGKGFLDQIEMSFESRKEEGFTLGDLIERIIDTYEFLEEKELIELGRNMVIDSIWRKEGKFYVTYKEK